MNRIKKSESFDSQTFLCMCLTEIAPHATVPAPTVDPNFGRIKRLCEILFVFFQKSAIED
jgi:hypothetical protein